MTESEATRPESGPLNQPQVDVDDLRRSGRISIWPYMMRNLPISPIEALRCEMRSRMAVQLSTHAVGSNGGSSSKQTNVQFMPARLTDGRNQGETTAFFVREQQRQQQHRPRADSAIDAPHSRPAEVQKRHQDILAGSTLTSTPNCGRQDSPVDMKKRRARSTGSSPERHNKSWSRCRPTSSGARRPPDSGPEGRSIDSFPLQAAGDRTECPLGCGEEVRLYDVMRHQTSQCTFRYIDCMMPGCGAIVRACKISVHLERECLMRKKQQDLAVKATASELQEPCDACGSLVSRKTLRAHRANECGMRLVHCSRLGCTQKVTAKSIADHERNDCATARHNAVLIDQAARRSATEECLQCHAGVPTATLRKHAVVECSMRIVACPNKHLGCDEKLRAAKVTLHLRDECFVQQDRAERASRFAKRRERVRCSGCGYTVAAPHLASHQRNKCSNRKVPCKHWELGCPVMVRLSAMDEHLKVDRLLDPRSCLVFDGGRAYIALDGGDRKPPWTVEMWIWRPGLVESTREKARTALQAYWEFQQSRVQLKAAEQRLSMLEPLLAAAATKSSKERSRETEGTRDKLMDEVVDAATLRDDAKVELVVASVVLSNSLAAATRGVEEITAQDQLRGFDRLALASTPWYAVPSDARKGKKFGGGRGEHGKGENTTVKQTRTLPSSDASSQLSQRPSGLKAGGHERGDSHHQLSIPDSGNIDEGTTSSALEAAVAGTMTGLIDRGSETSSKKAVVENPAGFLRQSDLLSNGGHENAVYEEAEVAGEALAGASEAHPPLDVRREAYERALAQKEASFWAEWVALSGKSLAGRVLHLSGETLPLLKEEVVALTGVSADAIFRSVGNSNNAAGEETRPDDGFATADNDDSSASTKMSSNKSAAKKAARKAKRKQKHEQKFGKKLESRIAEEVGKRGGVETLFGSDKALFQLEIGAQDRVGIKVTGQPDQAFNYRCPRERWVHLAFVSDSSGVFLLENGKTASRLHDVTVALPMREIGGRETACQCLVQEVRYWKVKRSKDELEGWMHEVLRTPIVMEELLGYWTFEEGAGEYVHDVTEQCIRARMVGRGLNWVTPELMCTFQVGEAPTPSWREQNVCKVELRRRRLAHRGRLHREFAPCPSGCGEFFLQTTMRAHLAYRCKLRVISCSMAACGKRVVANDLARYGMACGHLREDCASHQAWLRMAEAGEEKRESCSCPHCSETVRKCNLKVHIKYVCQWAKDPCRNPGCGALIPRVRLVEHERKFCGASCAIGRRRRLAAARARSEYYRGWA